jgi:hypothetical protein
MTHGYVFFKMGFVERLRYIDHGRICYPFKIHYAHLHKTFFNKKNLGMPIKRGEPIGNVTTHNNYAKLMLQRLGTVVGKGWADPDLYGFNHSHMDYISNVSISEIDEQNMKEPEKVREKAINQKWSINKIAEECVVKGMQVKMENVYHQKRRDYGIITWSEPEKFKYLETLYEIKPELFPNLSNDYFQKLKKEFFENQPIILTLPFKKSGLRKS